MREIKFRGYENCSGLWRYGSLLVEDGKYYIIQNIQGSLVKWLVAPKTVGQFTGMQTKDGQDVYEGDIIQVPATMLNGEIRGVVEYRDDEFIVKSLLGNYATGLAWALRKRMEGEPMARIVGNIHDNTEFSKGSEA